MESDQRKMLIIYLKALCYLTLGFSRSCFFCLISFERERDGNSNKGKKSTKKKTNEEEKGEE